VHIGITGASGLIGRHLVDLALRRGHEVVAFSRSPGRKIPGCTMRPFAPPSPPDISGCDALVHLAGESVIGFWTPAKKRRIVESRLTGTRAVAQAIARAATPPEVLVSGSAIGFYPDAQDDSLTESSPGGTGFLAETTRAWEAEAHAVTRSRVVLLRTGIALAREGGALALTSTLFRWGLGGRLGSGVQWMSWIHVHDLARLMLFAVENLDVNGPVNGTAPWPVRNRDFTQELARQLHRPAFLHAPAWALRLLGDFSHELLDSKRVLPEVATAHGFRFEFPELPQALANLV
jgi:uncharacterized protein (TIGR01777 family)